MTSKSNGVPEQGDQPAAAEEAGNVHLSVEEQLSALHQDLEEARLVTSRSQEAVQRAQAELANYRRRSDEERISQGKYSNGRLITKLLPVVEELDLAVTHAGAESTNASWLEGIKLIQRKMQGLLESEGVTAIEAVGELFNPLEHEALGTVESSEYPPGHVTEALRPGYRLHDRVIQPAQVMVAREPQDTESKHASTETKETQNE